MESGSVVERVRAEGFLLLLDLPPEALAATVEAVLASGVKILAVSADSAGPAEVAARAAGQADPRAIVGGEVRSLRAARDALRAGARFLLMPTLDPDAIRLSRDAGVPIISGVLTPTELRQARDLGVEAVEIFPAGSLGPAYFSALRRAVPDIVLLAAGELAPKQIGPFFDAGAAAAVVSPAWTREGASGVVASLQGIREAVSRARGKTRGWWGRWAPQEARPIEGPDK